MNLTNTFGSTGENKIQTGSIFGIGAVRKINLGYFVDKKYVTISKDGSFEVGACNGNISLKEGTPFIHLHMICQDYNQGVFCGHVMEGCIVHPTMEIIIFEFEKPIKRKFDEDLGLFIWNL